MDVRISARVSVGVNTHTDTHVDWSFDASPPHSHHEHPTPLTPARKPHLVLGQCGGEDHGDGEGGVHEESDEGECRGNGDSKGDGGGGVGRGSR